MRTILVISILSLAATAFGQISADEARHRLEERRATASTQAATTQPNLAAQTIAELKAENQKLRSEVADLQKQLDEMTRKAETAQATTQRAAAEGRTVKVGMTLAEAKRAMGKPGTLVSSDASGVEQYSWDVYTAPSHMQPYKVNGQVYNPPEPKLLYTIFATFENGKATLVQRQ